MVWRSPQILRKTNEFYRRFTSLSWYVELCVYCNICLTTFFFILLLSTLIIFIWLFSAWLFDGERALGRSRRSFPCIQRQENDSRSMLDRWLVMRWVFEAQTNTGCGSSNVGFNVSKCSGRSEVCEFCHLSMLNLWTSYVKAQND